MELRATMRDAGLPGERVDDHRDRQHRAGDHEAQRGRQVQQRQAAGDRLDHDDAQHRRIRAAAAAEQAGAADHGRCDSVQVHVAAAGLRLAEASRAAVSTPPSAARLAHSTKALV